MGASECQFCAIELLRKDSGAWAFGKEKLTNLERQASFLLPVCIIFAQAKQIRECKDCRAKLSRIFAIPPSFWTDPYKRSNGYSGCEDSYDNLNVFESHYTWFRFLVKQMLGYTAANGKDYTWYKVNVFTRWWPAGRNLIIIFDPPPALRMRLPTPMLDEIESIPTHDPYWIHLRFLEELVRIQDESVWAIRDLVRQRELNRTSARRPNPDYLRLHDVARHATHSVETLRVAETTVDKMIIQHDHFIADRAYTSSQANIEHKKTRDRLLFYSQMIESFKYRSEANRERLQNEITLAFHMVAQYDSKVSVQIGQAAQSDSAAMKTIAFLTLAFFPATFVCAIFSMSFFTAAPGNQDQAPTWSVSEQIWVYWAVAVPLTGFTVASWILWQRYFPVRQIGM